MSRKETIVQAIISSHVRRIKRINDPEKAKAFLSHTNEPWYREYAEEDADAIIAALEGLK